MVNGSCERKRSHAGHAITASLTALAMAATLLGSDGAAAQSSTVRMCDASPMPSWCSAVRGDRSED